VAGLPAELRSIHIFHAAVRSCSKDEDVQKGRGTNDKKSVPDHGFTEINGRVNVPQFSPGFERATPEQNAHGNQQQAQDENPGQNQKEQNADIWMRWSGQQKVIKPKGDQGNRASGSEYGANEADRILSEKVEEP
jgi:hypothetical protein